MNKDDVINKMNDLDIPVDQYWIVAGSALVLHGVREETGDIDLGITTDLYENMLKSGYRCTTANDGTRVIHLDDDIEAFENWAVEEVVFIADLPVGSLESIIKRKKKLNRKKDLRDIELINSFLRDEQQKI